MCNPQLLGVQEMPTEIANVRSQSSVLNHVVAAASVRLVTNYRVSKPRQVHTNLMRSSSLQLDI